ncbi:hypothetical protein [Mangrovicoccus sp. HB161399]|uniref:hypothetical protein n=1 Tax=Mangrovicoccus sp. HB161399 TaxID=2720392 RepID=UPI001556685A|nr:hypothetical protein [Mangrovicoccus sp. HB161399]
MHEVTITGLTRVSRPKPNRAGYRILAFFDCEASGFILHGCAFVRTPRNGLTVWPPKLTGSNAERCAVEVQSEHLRKELVRCAQDAYRALGGTDGEWMPHDPDDLERRAENSAAASRRIQLKHAIATENAETEGLKRFLSDGVE